MDRTNHVNMLLKIHKNYLKSNYIKNFTLPELEEALARLKTASVIDRNRCDLINAEIQRRILHCDSNDYNVTNYERKGFTEGEWEKFARKWTKACELIRNHGNRKKTEKLVINWERKKHE